MLTTKSEIEIVQPKIKRNKKIQIKKPTQQVTNSSDKISNYYENPNRPNKC